MPLSNPYRLSTATLTRWATPIALALFMLLPQTSGAQADDADMILKAMSAYLASQNTMSFSFDADIEVITPEIQKIQYASSGQALLSRPDKLRATRTGGYADVELVFDGKTATVFGKSANAFAQLDAPGSIDQLVDRLRNQYSIALPGADLLSSHVYEDLTEDVVEGVHVGRGVIDGVECEHLAFRDADTDWQLWVEVGDHPLPHKYVITSKTIAGAPQYTLRISNWKTGVQAAADAFAFKAPEGAKKVEITALSDLDEVPPGVAKGAKK
jgi:hypothetical protein